MAQKKPVAPQVTAVDSNPKMRGVKKFGGENVTTGNIIVRQKRTKFHAGEGVLMGRDFTLFAARNGNVKFSWFNKKTKVVSVI